MITLPPSSTSVQIYAVLRERRHKFRGADSSLSFAPRSKDTFNVFHADLLLGQAIVYLERAVRVRSEFEDIAVKAFNLQQDITAYRRARKILETELAAGLLTAPVSMSEASVAAETAASKGYGDACEALTSLLERAFADSNWAELDGLARYMAWGNHYPATSEMMALKFVEFRRGLGGNLPDVMQAPTARLQWYEYQRLLHQVTADQASLRAQRDSSLAHLSGLRDKLAFDKVDAEQQLERIKLADDLATRRTASALQQGGALNFDEQMSRTLVRLTREYQEGLDRLIAAHDGLQKLFGYSDAFPPSVTAVVESKDTGSDLQPVIEDALNWARKASSWLDAFQQRDEVYAWPVSLQRAGRQEWDRGKQTGVWTLSVDETSYFAAQRHVRLRGISVFVVTKTRPPGQGVWQVTVDAPQGSYCRFLGDGISDPHRELQQSSSPCRLGRVSDRNSVRGPDIAGVVSLRNLSPFGTWRIQINDTATDGTLRSDISDVVVDLCVAARSLRPPG